MEQQPRSPNVVAGNTAGVGFVSYIFVLLILSKTGVEPNMFIPVTFIYFAALFGMCFMFLRQGFVSQRNMPEAERSDKFEPDIYSARHDRSACRADRSTGERHRKHDSNTRHRCG